MFDQTLVSATASPVTRAHGPRLRILVVEDDDELRRALVDALAPDAHLVEEACNGAVAERMAFETNDCRYDLVITDIRMPGRSGTELLEALRARGSSIPVILLSGFGDAASLADATTKERTLLFSKPFDIDDLRTAIRNLDHVMPRAPRPTVLVAEDNDALLELVSRALDDAGFDVQTAADGHAMLSLLEKAALQDTPPHALVMDVRMPRLDGLDVLRALRLSRWDVPVVLMTAFPDEDTLQRAAQLGAACTLEKPLDLDDLVRAVTIVTELAEDTRATTAPPR